MFLFVLKFKKKIKWLEFYHFEYETDMTCPLYKVKYWDFAFKLPKKLWTRTFQYQSFSGPLANDSAILSAFLYARRQESSKFENIETKPRKSLVFILKTCFPNMLFYLLIMLVTLLLLIVLISTLSTLNKHYKLTDEQDFDRNKASIGWSNEMRFGPIYNRCDDTNISLNLGP